jgi:Rad3-related DNA helicase
MTELNPATDPPDDGADAETQQISPTFHHPYQPYDVQLDFMRTLYSVLAKGNNQVGILESPTGTVRYLLAPIFIFVRAEEVN